MARERTRGSYVSGTRTHMMYVGALGPTSLVQLLLQHNRRFARVPVSSHDAHRPLLPHENLDRLFRWQEERRVTQNLTLHYQRVMCLLEPNELSRAAAGKRVLVSETNDGKRCEHCLAAIRPRYREAGFKGHAGRA